MGLNGLVKSFQKLGYLSFALFSFLAFVAEMSAQQCNAGCPKEVIQRLESGEIFDIQSLLQKHNPEYARLSFASDQEVNDFAEGWNPWYGSSKIFKYVRATDDSLGFLFLDGDCSWIVHDLATMEDISRSKMAGITTGTFPVMFDDKFFMVGGYGNFRFHRNWYNYDPRRGMGIGRNNDADAELILTGDAPPNVLYGVWRDAQKKSFFYLADAHAFDEPNAHIGDKNFALRADSIRSATRRYQIWRYLDNDTITQEDGLIHFQHHKDLDPTVFNGHPPIGMVESKSWAIFIDEDTWTTSMLRKSTFDWVKLKRDHWLPMPERIGLYGWMIDGDSLMVVQDAEVVASIDLNKHAQLHRLTSGRGASNGPLLWEPQKPEYKFALTETRTPWEWIALGFLALIGIVVWSRQKLKPMAGELKNMTKQIQVVEYFSRSIFRSTTAEDILWDITAKTISQLHFDRCEMYLLAEDERVWIQKTMQVKGQDPARHQHQPTAIPLQEGLIGAVGLSGNLETIDSAAKDGRFDVNAFGCESLMAVPIVCDARVIGVIVCGHQKAGFFQPEHKRIVQNVANICGQKLGRTLSEKKISEFAQVYEQSPGPVMRIKEDGGVLLTNDSAKAHFGVHATVGKPLQFLDIVERAKEALAKNQPLATSLHHRSRIYQVNLLPYPDLGYVNMYASDVTELEQARARAEKAERAKTDFLSVMSHEIRTPLNAIMGLNELMLKSEPSDDQVKQLKYMQYSGKQLLSLVNDILSLESLEDAKAAMKPSTFNVHELMHRLAETFADQAKARGNVVEVVCPPADEAWVSGDRHWVSQMVNNLLDNAVKFTQRGTITLSTRPSAQPERWIIDVEDSGIGIAADHLARITDPFEQVLVNPKNTAADQGTGLGLAIVKKLATLHGGELQVQSTEGVGSKFTLNLAITPSDAPETSSATPSNSDHLADPQGLRVLIVDDNAMNLMVAKKQVEMLGHKVISAIHGQEAVEQWRQHHPDFILMDLQMPVMDGMEATRQIRRLIQKSGGKHVPIVALTADAESSTHDEALAAGLDEVLVKPADTEILRQAIARGVLGAKG